MVSVLQWRIHWQLCTECIEGPKSIRYVPNKDVSDKILVGDMWNLWCVLSDSTLTSFTSLHNGHQTEQNFNIFLWCVMPCSLVERSMLWPEYFCSFPHSLFLAFIFVKFYFLTLKILLLISLVSSHSNTNWPFSGPKYFLYFIILGNYLLLHPFGF